MTWGLRKEVELWDAYCRCVLAGLLRRGGPKGDNNAGEGPSLLLGDRIKRPLGRRSARNALEQLSTHNSDSSSIEVIDHGFMVTFRKIHWVTCTSCALTPRCSAMRNLKLEEWRLVTEPITRHTGNSDIFQARLESTSIGWGQQAASPPWHAPSHCHWRHDLPVQGEVPLQQRHAKGSPRRSYMERGWRQTTLLGG